MESKTPPGDGKVNQALDWTSIGATHEQIFEKMKMQVANWLSITYFATDERGFSRINPKAVFRNLKIRFHQCHP